MAIAPSSLQARPTLTRVAAAKSKYMSDGSGGVTGSRLLVLLYQRLVRDLVNAESAIDLADVETTHHLLIHAQEIIEALDAALDRTAWDGGEQLGQLYRFLATQLVEANVTKDRAVVSNCRRLVEPLADAWQEAWTATNATTPAPAGLS